VEVRIVTGSFDPQAEQAAFCAGRDDQGALVSFVGLCRAQAGNRRVDGLFLDQYPGFTEREMTRMCAVLAERCGCPDLLVIHRVGLIGPGEPIVLVAALAEHRGRAFDTVRLVMDYLKTDAPLWKKEIGPDGERWIEPSDEDRRRRAEAEDGLDD